LMEAISDGDNGELLTPCCADEYVEHIHTLLRDKNTRYAKGQKAMAYVKQHFTWKVIADCYLKTFNKYLRNISGQTTKIKKPNKS
jgi:glycosyltransferase involved in cell wall biosynthesis